MKFIEKVLITLAALAVMAGLSSGICTAVAQASVHHHHRHAVSMLPNAYGHDFCLLNANNSCWTTNGVGNSITDTISGNATDVRVVRSTSKAMQIEDGNGNCYYVNSTGKFSVVNAVCNKTSKNEWIEDIRRVNGGLDLVSEETGFSLWVKDWPAGYAVHATGDETPGAWSNWGYYSSS